MPSASGKRLRRGCRSPFRIRDRHRTAWDHGPQTRLDAAEGELPISLGSDDQPLVPITDSGSRRVRPRTRRWASGPTTSSTSWTVATEAPLAEAGSPSGRFWNPSDIAVSAVVDTARNGPLTVRHGDSGDLGFRASGSRAEGAIMATAGQPPSLPRSGVKPSSRQVRRHDSGGPAGPRSAPAPRARSWLPGQPPGLPGGWAAGRRPAGPHTFAGLRGARSEERGARCVFVLRKHLAGGFPRTPERHPCDPCLDSASWRLEPESSRCRKQNRFDPKSVAARHMASYYITTWRPHDGGNLPSARCRSRWVGPKEA